MSELGPEARAILDAGRHGDDPTESDRKRVRSSLMNVIAAGGVGAAAAIAGKTAAASVAPKAAASAVVKTAPLGAAFAGKLFAVVALTSAAGGAWYAWSASHPAGAPESAPPIQAQATQARPAVGRGAASPGVEQANLPEQAPAAEPTPPAEPVAPTPSADPPAAAPEPPREVPIARDVPRQVPSVDPLEAEARQLRKVHDAIQSGDAEHALADLDAQNRAYARGQLGEERSATRVLALCKLGRVDEAKAAAARFIAEHPRSPLVDRMRSPCGEGK